MKTAFFFYFFLLFYIVFSPSVYAVEPANVVTVISTGIGVDPEGAKTNAIRNAIEQVVGTYITSETIIKNDDLIADQILGYSGGFVKESRIISQGKSPDGLFTAKIETQVVATKLKNKLQELNVVGKEMDGESFFGEAESRVRQQVARANVLGDVFRKYPQAAYTFDIGKPKIISTNSASNKAKVQIPVSIRFDEKYIKKLEEVLHNVSNVELANVELSKFDGGVSKKRKRNATSSICFARLLPLKSGLLDKCWTFEESEDQLSFVGINLLSQNFDLNYFFKNKQGEIIERLKHRIEIKDTCKKQGIELGSDFESRMNSNILNSPQNPPNILGRLVVLTNGTYLFNEPLEVGVEILNKISSVEVSFGQIFNK